MNQHYEQEKLKTQEKKIKLKKLFKLQRNEKREFTTSERISLQALQDEMDRTAIQHMSANQMEQKVIYENMRVQASEITARQVPKLLRIVRKQEIK